MSINAHLFKYNHAKFHPDLISNNKALGFLKQGHPNKNNNKKNNKMSSNI